jgi:hypothetical protein
MKKTAALISLGTSMADKYGFVKTASISDVLSNALDQIEQYLSDPFYKEEMYGNPKIKQKLHATITHMRDLQTYLDTPHEFLSKRLN